MSARKTAALNGQTMYEGRPCPRCGLGRKYVSNSNCVKCHAERVRLSARGEELTPMVLDKLDAKLLQFPVRTVRINRSCRLPLVVEIPSPAISLVNRRWATC